MDEKEMSDLEVAVMKDIYRWYSENLSPYANRDEMTEAYWAERLSETDNGLRYDDNQEPLDDWDYSDEQP